MVAGETREKKRENEVQRRGGGEEYALLLYAVDVCG